MTDGESCVEAGSGDDGAPRFLARGGEMGARMRALDWSDTPLGPVEGWPQSLKSAVSIMLNSRFPIAIYWGPDLALLYNDAWAPIPGEKHPWALGRAGREVWPEIWDTIGPLYAKVIETGEGVWQEDELLPMHRHGYLEECYYNFTFSPIAGEDGAVEGIFNAVVETTERVLSERRLRTLSRMGERSDAALSVDQACGWIADILGTNTADAPFALIYVREEGIARLVAATGLAAGTPAAPLTLPLDERSLWPVVQAMEGAAAIAGPPPVDVALDNPAWPEPVVETLTLPVAVTGESSPSAFLIAGVNPRRRLDAGYRAFFELAAGHVATAIATARAYQEERRRAEALAAIDQAKTAFFSNVSHEFRTPLALMLGPLEDALASDAGLDDAQRERIEAAHRNAQRLLRLVNTLLDFARIEAGRAKARFEPTDLAALTADLASSFRSATDRAGLTLTIDAPPLTQPVFVDHEMWEKVVLNLVSNAFKFTFEGGIAVSVRQDGQDAVLIVRDTGVGIPEAAQGALFDRFSRVEGAQGRSFEGSGIGLALVQELVRQHGGEIRVESREGEGSAFIVSLPLGSGHLPAEQVHAAGDQAWTTGRAQAFVAEALRWLPDAGSTAAAGEANTTNDPSAHVLLADDNADLRGYIARILTEQGYGVMAVSDGEEALAALAARRPDLLLTDVMMPRLDGFGLLAAIRADDALRDLPVIMLSARAGEEARVEGLEASADDYLVKPFSARELLARVSGAIATSRLRREMTLALSESEARFRNMADHAPVMMWVTDPDGACTYLNKAWYDFTGQGLEAALGAGWLEAVHPEDRAWSGETFFAANAERTPFRLEYRLRRRDGVYRWAIDAASPRFAEDGTFLGYIGSVLDITERKEAEILVRENQAVLQSLNATLEERVATEIAERLRAEDALRQAQKMEAVGQLTGGVAHDFNNLLTVIIGGLDTIKRSRPGDETRIARAADMALQGAQRAAGLTERLLAFSRRQPLAPKPLDANALVRDMTELLHRTLGEQIELEVVLTPRLWTIEADPNQLESAILNLAVNARDAMPEGGKLTIETANTMLDEAYVEIDAEVTPGQYVGISVTDTGAGMSKETMARVFEPFFTTKEVGKGTGLGLSMVYGLAKQSGGHVTVYSEEGQGTTVRLYFPRRAGSGVVMAEAAVATAPRSSEGEIVLVVEDNDEVRAYSVMILSELGYGVIQASSADAALDILGSEARIDLLFTDVVLPGKSGRAIADAAESLRPGLKVLFTTGYSRNAIVHHGRLDPGVQLITKPFTFDQLAARVRAALDRS